MSSVATSCNQNCVPVRRGRQIRRLWRRPKVATEPILGALDLVAVQRRRRLAISGLLVDYWKLTKPEINFLIVITTAVGFWMGTVAALPDFPWMPFFPTLFGTACVAGGAATLNQLIELRYDAQMRRTARRPLVSGRIAPSHGLWFRSLVVCLGRRVPCPCDECHCVFA